MLRFHSICFTDKLSFLNWIGECLIFIDAGVAIVTLGVVELNLSSVYWMFMEHKYGDKWTQDNRDNF
jgi:hypothetical protein